MCGLIGGFCVCWLVIGVATLAFDDPWSIESLLSVPMALTAGYICLAFAPVFLLIKGLETKTSHWVSIAILELMVFALPFYVLFN